MGAYINIAGKSLFVDLRGYDDDLMQLSTQPVRRAMPGKVHCPSYNVLSTA